MLAKKQGSKGFSLVELMIVVAIIGVLAALAIPKFQVFQAKARQSEAKTNVAHLYTLEESFYGANDQYTGMISTGNSLGGVSGTPASCPYNSLGFNPLPCNNLKIRYQYSATAAGGGTTFVAQAISGTGLSNQVMPGCAVADLWTINETNFLKVASDSTILCQ